MGENALMLTLLFAVANSYGYYGEDQPASIFDTIPQVLHSMIKSRQNTLRSTYNQQLGINNFNPGNGYKDRLNPVYQQNMGYQNGQSIQSFNMANNQGLLDPVFSDPSQGFTGNPSTFNNYEIDTTSVKSTELPQEMLHLSTNSPVVTNVTNLKNETASNDKIDVNSLTNKNTNMPQIRNVTQDIKSIEPDNHKENESSLNKEKEHAKVNKPRDPDAIIFPDSFEEVREEAQQNHKSNKSEYPNRFNDTPQILYAVNIAPTGTSQWNNKTPLTNPIKTQTPPLTNAYMQAPNHAAYATLLTPNQVPSTNKMAEANPFGNNIVLPNANGGSTTYTVLNLPNTIADAGVPSKLLQSTNLFSNPNYQQQTSIPTTNSGIINEMPTYYVVSLPNQPLQTVQTSLPYTNAPVKYSVGYISSNGQIVLVPNTPIVYQIVPVSQSNAPQSYVPVSNVQANVVSQPLNNNQNSATVTYLPVSNQGNGQQTYVTVPNLQENAAKNQINYVPVTTAQVKLTSQPNYMVLTNGQDNTGSHTNEAPNPQLNTANPQVNHVPGSGQGVTANQPNYVTLTNGQDNTASIINVVPNSQDTANAQIKYVPMSSGQDITANQPNYVTVTGNTENAISILPNPQVNTANAQINYLPVTSGQDVASQPSYVTLTENTGSQINVVPISNGQDLNTQNYVPADQGNVVTLTAPSDAVVLPADTQTLTILSFKDKEEKQKEKTKKEISKEPITK